MICHLWLWCFLYDMDSMINPVISLAALTKAKSWQNASFKQCLITALFECPCVLCANPVRIHIHVAECMMSLCIFNQIAKLRELNYCFFRMSLCVMSQHSQESHSRCLFYDVSFNIQSYRAIYIALYIIILIQYQCSLAISKDTERITR